MLVGERSLLQKKVPTVHGYSAEKSARRLTPFWNEAGEQVQLAFLGYISKPKDRIYV